MAAVGVSDGAGGGGSAGGAGAAKREYLLAGPPTDGVSSLGFSPTDPNLLLVSSWDKSVRLYDVSTNATKAHYDHKAAVLDCCFVSDTLVASGGLDQAVLTNDVASGVNITLGTHSAPVKTVNFNQELGVVITGSWDRTVAMWDPRTAAQTGTYAQPERVYSLDTAGSKILVAHAGKSVQVYDVRNMSEPEMSKDSPLKCQTRVARFFPGATGYALGCIEGRVAVDYIVKGTAKPFAFKCHRQPVDGVEHVYPVNALAFHPIHQTLATGGCDRYVCTWDTEKRRRVWQFHPYPSSIAALAFNSTGTVLAIASSYTFEQGDVASTAPDAVYIRTVVDSDVKSKAKGK